MTCNSMCDEDSKDGQNSHPCAVFFRMLSGFVEFDGYYLESDPCLVCNNPEVPFQVRFFYN